MNIENDLRKDGIIVISPLDTLSITLIAKFVSDKFISFFPFSKLRYNDFYTKVINLKMYVAEMPDGMSEANYFYKNSSIYFKQGLTMDQMKELTIHEFIHHFQEVKNSKNILYRLGLCDFTNLKVKDMALNEAAVQLLSSKILKNKAETVKYYGIDFSTTSPSYYPLICTLINQMAYIVGENVLFDSTLYSNDKFKNAFIKLTSQSTFNKISQNFDKILNTEEKIIELTNKSQNSDNITEKEIAKISSKIKNYKKVIKDTFFETQNRILTSYFDKNLNNLYSYQDIDEYRQKLYCYKDLLGTTDNYTFFNDYYINLMSKLDDIYDSIEGNTALVVYKRSIFEILFSKLSKIWNKQSAAEDIYHLNK